MKKTRQKQRATVHPAESQLESCTLPPLPAFQTSKTKKMRARRVVIERPADARHGQVDVRRVLSELPKEIAQLGPDQAGILEEARQELKRNVLLKSCRCGYL